MTTSTDPADVARAVATGVSRLVAGNLTSEAQELQLDELASLYAEQTDVRHPLAPLGDTPLRSRAQLREHFATVGRRAHHVTRFEPANMTVHRTEDAEQIIVEFSYAGEAEGLSFELPCIFALRVRDGCIVKSRDYADHIGLARVFGTLDALADQLASRAAGPAGPSDGAPSR